MKNWNSKVERLCQSLLPYSIDLEAKRGVSLSGAGDVTVNAICIPFYGNDDFDIERVAQFLKDALLSLPDKDKLWVFGPAWSEELISFDFGWGYGLCWNIIDNSDIDNDMIGEEQLDKLFNW